LATVTDGKGTKKTIHHEVKFLPAPGYLPITVFMAGHLTAYDTFLADMFAVLAALKFQPK
jgi:hypothetical protein